MGVRGEEARKLGTQGERHSFEIFVETRRLDAVYEMMCTGGYEMVREDNSISILKRSRNGQCKYHITHVLISYYNAVSSQCREGTVQDARDEGEIQMDAADETH